MEKQVGVRNAPPLQPIAYRGHEGLSVKRLKWTRLEYEQSTGQDMTCSTCSAKWLGIFHLEASFHGNPHSLDISYTVGYMLQDALLNAPAPQCHDHVSRCSTYMDAVEIASNPLETPRASRPRFPLVLYRRHYSWHLRLLRLEEPGNCRDSNAVDRRRVRISAVPGKADCLRGSRR